MTEPTPQPVAKPANSPWVRLVSDLGPALVFFFAYGHANKPNNGSTHSIPDWAIPLVGDQPVLFATLVFLPAAVLGFAFSFWRERSVSPIGLFSFVMIGVFSGLALWFKDDIFIKMRPTLIYGMMGAILLASVALKRNILKGLFSGALHMPEPQWAGLATRAGIMYLSLSAINELVWRTQTKTIWVTYNTWGDLAINMVFWIVNMVFLSKFFTDADGKPLVDEK
jgi:intracellular septation protein